MDVERRPSLRALAKMAGVSLCTASRAMHEDPLVTPATRARIQAVAKKMGYRPSAAMARFLSTVRSAEGGKQRETLGFLWTDTPEQHVHAHEFAKRLYDGAKARAAELNFSLDEFFWTGEAKGKRQLERVLRARGIRGLLVAGSVSRALVELDLDCSRLHVVAIGRGVSAPRFNRVVNDQFGITTLALRHLLALGYRRIGLIHDRDDDERSAHRISGAYIAGLLAAGLKPLEIEALSGGVEVKGMQAWLKNNNPDCVLASVAGLFEAVRAGAEAGGLPVPDFAALNLTPDDARTSGVYQRYESLAGAAVELLASALVHHTAGVPPVARQMTIAPEWRAGKTTRRL